MLQRLHSLQEEMHSEFLKEEAKRDKKDVDSERPFAMFAKPGTKVTPKKKNPDSDQGKNHEHKDGKNAENNPVQEEEKENPTADKVAALKGEEKPVSKSGVTVSEEIIAALGEKNPAPKRPLRQIVSDTSNTNIVNSNIIVSCSTKLTDYREKIIENKGETESCESSEESVNSNSVVIDGGGEVLDQGDRLIGASKTLQGGKDFIDQIDSETEANESKRDKQAVITVDNQVPGCSAEPDSGESGGFDPSDKAEDDDDDGWTCSICGKKPKNQVPWKPNLVCYECGKSPEKDSENERNRQQQYKTWDSGRKRDGITVEERKMRIKRSLSPSYYSEDLHTFKRQRKISEDILACKLCLRPRSFESRNFEENVFDCVTVNQRRQLVKNKWLQDAILMNLH